MSLWEVYCPPLFVDQRHFTKNKKGTAACVWAMEQDFGKI